MRVLLKVWQNTDNNDSVFYLQYCIHQASFEKYSNFTREKIRSYETIKTT
jgi:hypothetical protein